MTLDFDALRKKRGVTTSGTGEFDFDAYRNRKVTETPDVERVTVNPILKSTLSGVGIGEKPMEFPTYSRAVTPEPAPKKEEKSTLSKVLDNVNAFTDRAANATTFGGTDLVDRLFEKFGPKAYSDELKEKRERSENLGAAGAAADVLGSLVSGQAAYKAAGAAVDPLIKSLPKITQSLIRGTAAGAAFELPRQANQEAAEYLGGQQQSVPQRLKNVGLSAALGGLTDLGIGAGGLAASGIKNPLLGKAVGGGIGVGSLGAALGTANELQEKASGQQQSLGGRLADIGKYTLAGAGLGIAGGTAAATFMRNKGVPEETIAEVLALPEGRGTIRQSAAAERASVPAGTDPIINPSDFTPEPLGLPQGNAVGPTVARRATQTNVYRQKFENLIREAQKREFSPGREDIELENLWSQMAERNDPGLEELVDLAYPKRTNVPQRGMVGAARSNQEMREVAGVGNPVRSIADRNPSQVISPAAAPQTVAGRAGGTPRAEITGTPDVPVSSSPRQLTQENIPSQPISREQDIMNRINNLTQEDIDYIQSGQFDQTKLPPEVSSISRQEPAVREQTPLVDAAPDVNAQPQSQDMFTDLFGDQGLGISSGGSSARVGTGPVDTADQIVRRGIKNDKQGIKQAATAQARATYQNLVDNLDPLKRISSDTYESAMDATRANNLANTVVRDKFVNLEGEVIGSSLNDIFKKVARGQDKNFIDYLTLRHAKTRMARGERVYAENLDMTPDKVQQRIDTLNSRYPGFEEIAQEWDKFNDNVLREIGVKEGLLSNELYNALRKKNPNYSPMRRQFLRSEKPGKNFIQKTTKSSFSGQKAPIQQVSPTGSVRNIVDPRKSTIESVGAWTNAALRNRTMQSMVDAIKRDPEAFKGVAEIIKQPKSKVNLKDVLTNGGQDDFLEALDADFKDLFSTAKVDGDNVVRAMVNGEPVHIKVEDPEIVKTLIGMGPQASNILIDTMSAFSNATKRGATGLLAPAFAIKGATMDLAQSAIQSKNPPKQIAYTIYSIFSGIGDSLGIKGLRNWAQEYRRAGGGYTASLKGDRRLDTGISDMTRYPKLSPQNAAKIGVKAVKAPFKILEGIGNIAENAPRIAASKIERQSLGNQITPQNIRQAMSAGREITVNFSRKGALTRDIEAFVPYNNAAVQGTYRVLRAFKNNPVRTVAAIGTLAVLPKLYEYSKFGDDPDYQNLPARERMRFLIVNKNDDGTFTKIPMEPAYNSFGEATIEALRYFKDNDPTAFKGTMDALANAWTPPLVTGALQGATKGGGAEGSIAGVVNSTVAAPFVASVANQSFTGAPIVSQSLQDRSRPYQYDERTSAVAKKLGQTLDMSPQKVDYIIKAYGGDLARLVLPLTSDLGQGNVRNTLLKNFIIDPEFSNTLTDDFYDAKDKLNQAYADYNEAGAELPSWFDDDLRKALNSTAKGSVSKELAGLRDYKKEITADKSLTDKQRTEKLREIQQQINEIYININSALKEYGVIK
ncbi:LPD38 domain-containing protein [Paenibacillus sp. FSL R10-2771]|uniref:LPD38 domain-containing protein n=1 Tax=Paenibacillus sp. FSL R10-2771 TaxID=2954693 RepID=UPI0030F6E316